MGYTPAFDDIYDGTLYGKWPTAAVWASLIPLIDRRGEINKSFEAISGMTGWPMDLLRRGIEDLCAPDPASRTPAEDGRRLVLIDPGRPWGWRVVNHGKYREKARKMAYDRERTDSGADAERKRLTRDVPTRPDVSRDVPTPPALHTPDAEAEALRGGAKRASRLPDDFKPDLKYASDAVPDLDAQAEYERFRDFWRSKPGSAGTKLDWPATWRNWIRTCRDNGKYARRKEGAKGRSVPDAFEVARRGG